MGCGVWRVGAGKEGGRDEVRAREGGGGTPAENVCPPPWGAQLGVGSWWSGPTLCCSFERCVPPTGLGLSLAGRSLWCSEDKEWLRTEYSSARKNDKRKPRVNNSAHNPKINSVCVGGGVFVTSVLSSSLPPVFFKSQQCEEAGCSYLSFLPSCQHPVRAGAGTRTHRVTLDSC